MNWDDAFELLHEFADRGLLTLKTDPWSSTGKAYGLSFSQHDVLRDLALYLVKQDNKTNYSRLCMPGKYKGIPSKWRQVRASKAKIVSIHTESLEKLCLCLCEGLGNMNELDGNEIFNSARLLEINVHRCNDLEELPRELCSSKFLKLLVVRKCHKLINLPDEVEKLGLLDSRINFTDC
ncbi:hypothetical protein SUGI_0715150 [Cryptomeria japonica]|nr:hypothetical protein SUGI_0715150 [Cryptomeria japonica]